MGSFCGELDPAKCEDGRLTRHLQLAAPSSFCCSSTGPQVNGHAGGAREGAQVSCGAGGLNVWTLNHLHQDSRGQAMVPLKMHSPPPNYLSQISALCTNSMVIFRQSLQTPVERAWLVIHCISMLRFSLLPLPDLSLSPSHSPIVSTRPP